MIPLADMHCHLLAGLDDGPRTEEEAMEMCRIAYAEGTRIVSALAHQNEQWKENTPPRIREATRHLVKNLRDGEIPLTVFPCAEVMVHPEIESSWRRGELLSVADRREYLLIEMPHGLVVDLRNTVTTLRQEGLRPVLAHPERHQELLHNTGRLEELIRLGCLVQVSTKSITDPPSRREARLLKDWLKRGLVHLLGSDAHSPTRKPPLMQNAYQQIVHWAGASVADRVGSTNGLAISQGLPLHIPPVVPPRRTWFSWWQ